MQRKLVKQGNNALTVTLPKKWLDRYNLKAGNEISIDEKEVELIITAIPHKEHRIEKLDLDKVKEFIPKCLHSFYRQGINEIEVKYSDISLMDDVHKTLSENIIGFEVTEQHEHKAVLKNVADINEDNFEAMFRKIFLVNISMLESLETSMKTKNFKDLKSGISLEPVNNKLTNFCRRCISKRLQDGSEIFLTYCVLEVLERMADEMKFTMEYLEKNAKKVKINEAELTLIEETHKFFRMLVDTYFTDDYRTIIAEAVKRKHLVENTLVKFNECKEKDIYIMHYLLNVIVYCVQMFTYKFQIGLIRKEITIN